MGQGFIPMDGPCASSEHQDKLGTPLMYHTVSVSPLYLVSAAL